MKNKFKRNFSFLISHFSFRNPQQGQALLVAVLVMVVVLTIGLASASRSITNLRISTEEVNSQKAFSAAEAGIEYALSSNETQGTIIGGDEAHPERLLDNNSTIKETNVLSISGNQFVVNNGNPVGKDDSADIWFSNPNYTNPQNGNYFTLYWGSSGSCAAVEIIVISGASKAATETKRFAYDPCSGSHSPSNNFDSAQTGTFSVGGKTFVYKTPTNIFIQGISNIFFIRVIPLYAISGTVFGINTCDAAGNNCTDLPQQGKQIDSTGVSGETTRKISYFHGPAKIPIELFPAIIFSP